jgi:quercetin dioxygenase-like cupin family protein
MNEKVQFIHWKDRPIKNLHGGIQRKVITTDNIMIVQYIYEPGADFPKHQHPQEQVVMVNNGELEFWVEKEENKFNLNPGSILTIPGDMPHGARVLGDQPVDSINIFHPIKEEFLSESK